MILGLPEINNPDKDLNASTGDLGPSKALHSKAPFDDTSFIPAVLQPRPEGYFPLWTHISLAASRRPLTKLHGRYHTFPRRVGGNI